MTKIELKRLLNEKQVALDYANDFIGILGEELVSAGMPAGDRIVILANVRKLIKERRHDRTETSEGDTINRNEG